MKYDRNMGVLSGLVAMFGWGGADFLAALSSRKIGNVLTLWWMQVVGFLVALLYLTFNFATLRFEELPKFVFLLILVALFQLVAYLAFYRGLEIAQVSLVSPLGASWLVVTALLSVIFYGEILRANQVLAIFLIVVGIFLLSVDLRTLFRGKGLALLTGVPEGLVAMLGWGISLFLIVPASRSLGWFLPVLTFKLTIILLLGGYLCLSGKLIKMKYQSSTLKLLFFIGVLDMVAHMSYSYGVGGSYASIVAAVSGAFALVTVVLAKIFLKEKTDLFQGLGITGVILGLVLISL